MERDEFMDLVGADYVDEYDKAQLSQEDATIVAKSKRTFVELLVHYPHPDVCTYPEYKGKPYYSIKYIEDGECFVGFGTYKPEVLSQYLRDYFMPSAQLEERTEKRTETRACDLISRQAAIDAIEQLVIPEDMCVFEILSHIELAIGTLPPAQPEPKTALWIIRKWGDDAKCSNCGHTFRDVYDMDNHDRFCRFCGRRMIGVKGETT